MVTPTIFLVCSKINETIGARIYQKMIEDLDFNAHFKDSVLEASCEVTITWYIKTLRTSRELEQGESQNKQLNTQCHIFPLHPPLLLQV